MSEARYELLRPLGTGNFTSGVYLAEHRDLRREAAVKLLAVDQLNDRDALLEEARTMAALEHHDNVVQVLDAGDWDGVHVYIASEVCHDGSLESRCAPPHGPLDPSSACTVISACCRGLDFMHRQGLLHLDVRPANILISDGVPKLADFGLARWVSNARVPQVYAPHAAPEMLRDYDGSPASDQYALAMTLAHALTGGAACVMPPFPVSSDNWRAFPPLAATLGPNVPDRLKRVLVKATSFEPHDRYADVESFKRGVDRAAPAISFRMTGPLTMETADGSWAIEWSPRRAGWAAETKHNGRRVGRLSATGLTEAQAGRQLRSVVATLAYP